MKPIRNILTLAAGLTVAALSLSSCGEKKEDSKPASAGSADAGKPTASSESKPAAATPAAKLPAGDSEDLKIDYPKPMFVGTPTPTGSIPNLETADPEAVKKRDLKVPKGTVNLAKGKKVTSSDPAPIIGSLELVTDGDADGADGNYVELMSGKQWVQVDLGQTSSIWKVLLWHFHKNTAVYFSNVVQVSDDPEFKTGVTTLFNNDGENKLGLGKGNDKNYIETNHGRLIEGNGAKGRYVRCWSNGNSANEMNHYVELQVYGTPAK